MCFLLFFFDTFIHQPAATDHIRLEVVHGALGGLVVLVFNKVGLSVEPAEHTGVHMARVLRVGKVHLQEEVGASHDLSGVRDHGELVGRATESFGEGLSDL